MTKIIYTSKGEIDRLVDAIAKPSKKTIIVVGIYNDSYPYGAQIVVTEGVPKVYGAYGPEADEAFLGAFRDVQNEGVLLRFEYNSDIIVKELKEVFGEVNQPQPKESSE